MAKTSVKLRKAEILSSLAKHKKNILSKHLKLLEIFVDLRFPNIHNFSIWESLVATSLLTFLSHDSIALSVKTPSFLISLVRV